MLNEINYWIILEWVSVILGLVGTVWASSFKKYKLLVAFLIWMSGNFLMTILHIFHTGKMGNLQSVK